MFRHDFEEVPPRVEDEISEAGIELLVRRAPLWPWIVENAGRCRAAGGTSTGNAVNANPGRRCEWPINLIPRFLQASRMWCLCCRGAGSSR